MANVQSTRYENPSQGQAPDWARFLSGMVQGGAGQIAMQQQQARDQDKMNQQALAHIAASLASNGRLNQAQTGDPNAFNVGGKSWNIGDLANKPLTEWDKARINHANSAAELNRFKIAHPETMNQFSDLLKLAEANKATQEKPEGLLMDFFKKKNPISKQIEDLTGEMAKRFKTSPSGGYKVGDLIPRGDKMYRLTGYDTDGHPLVDPNPVSTLSPG